MTGMLIHHRWECELTVTWEDSFPVFFYKTKYTFTILISGGLSLQQLETGLVSQPETEAGSWW